MKVMITLSLMLNMLVLVPVTYGIATSASWVPEAYGQASAGRAILLAVYLAILIASVAFLFRPMPEAVATLLALQIIYKCITPFTVGAFDHPIVLTNLGIALFHAVTLWLIVQRSAA